MSPTVGAVHLCEPEQGVLQSPLTKCMLLNPMACNGKVCISVVCLPGITSEADSPSDSRALVYG